jgi:hypothetical protein
MAAVPQHTQSMVRCRFLFYSLLSAYLVCSYGTQPTTGRDADPIPCRAHEDCGESRANQRQRQCRLIVLTNVHARVSNVRVRLAAEGGACTVRFCTGNTAFCSAQQCLLHEGVSVTCGTCKTCNHCKFNGNAIDREVFVSFAALAFPLARRTRFACLLGRSLFPE